MSSRRFPAVVLAALLVLVALPTSAYHVPTQDDADTQTDAPARPTPPARAAAPVAPEGTWNGTLIDEADEVDTYRLDPPPKTLVRVRFQGPHTGIVLRGPGPTIDASQSGSGHGSRGRASVVAPNGSKVALRVETTHPRFWIGSYEEHAYEITVRYVQHDHFQPLRSPDRAAAWIVNATGNGFVRVSTNPHGYTSGFPEHVDADFSMFMLQLPRDDADCPASWQAGGRADRHAQNIWLRDPYDHIDASVDVPLFHGARHQAERAGERVYGAGGLTDDMAERDGTLEARLFFADSDGIGPVGWLVWDDGVNVTVTRPDARFRLLQPEDFEGRHGFRMGPAGTYANHGTAQLSVPDNRTHTNLFHFRANNRGAGWPGIGGPAHLHVERPIGETLHYSQLERLRTPFDGPAEGPGGFRLGPDHHDNPPGTWNLTLKHAGSWPSRTSVRAAFATYDVAPKCIHTD